MSKNKENWRRCFKCGRSPSTHPDQNITLFRFPKPGKTNTYRCEAWAKYCMPHREWFSPEFQLKLYSEHRMLCNKHFEKTSFSDYPLTSKKLHRFAVPVETNETTSQPAPLDEGEIDLPSTAPPPETITESLVFKSILQETSNFYSDAAISPETNFREYHKQVLEFPELNPNPNLPGPSGSEISTASQEMRKESQLAPVTLQQPTKQGKISKEKYFYAKCRKHMKTICQLRKRMNKLKNKAVLKELNTNDSVNVLVKKLTPTFALLLQGQIKNFKRKSKGRRWTTEEKITALRLYKRSPTCYRLMRRLFCLPAQSTLKSLLSHFSLDIGVNEPVFSILKKAAEEVQKASDNEYVLMFDEMSIRKNLNYNKKKDVIEGYQDHGLQGRCSLIASYALVFMIAGLRKKVKQPIAYYLSSGYVTADRLAVLIKEILQQCFKAGLHIAAAVCDMDGTNRKALGILGATADRPIITVDNVEVVTMFDPPHLLKCFRNLFLKYNIKCTTQITSINKNGEGVAKWSHIKDFHALDSRNPNFVFAPALRSEHLDPNSKQKMKVKLAAQTLSHTVAAGMIAKISDGQLTTAAVVTAELIEKMDRLFDAVNGDSADLRRGKVFSTNLKSSSPHLNFFKEIKLFFQSIQFLGSSRKPPSQEGWIWSLNAVELVWTNIIKKHEDVKSLATRRLQQDPLENLFGCIRGNCGSNSNPTAGQFVAALKTTILSKLAHQGAVGNCETDLCEAIINNYRYLLQKKDRNVCTRLETDFTCNAACTLSVLDDTDIISEEFEKPFSTESGEMQACAYICGFLLKNLDNYLNCEKCKIIFDSEERLGEHLFIENKEYSSEKQRLIYSDKKLINYIESCATETQQMLEKMGHETNTLKKIINSLKKINHDFLKPCETHFVSNHNYFVKNIAYICVKRFCVVKNRQFTQEAAKVSLKRKIDILQHR